MHDTLKSNPTFIIEPRGMLPIQVQERFEIIDVLRGVAILSILFLNMHPFSFPENFQSVYIKIFNGMTDKIVFQLVEFFGRGKFYSMLSFLFGLGMAVQVSRSNDTDKNFSLLYSRRLMLLLAIGLFHDLFLWGGIILIMYSSMGFFLLFFKKRHPQTLLTWAVIFILIPVLVKIVLPNKKTAAPPTVSVLVNQPQAADLQIKNVNDIIKIYQQGSYGDMFQLRLQKLKKTAWITARAGWTILGLFLLGIWAWQKGIFQDLEKNLKFIKKAWWYSLFLGMGGTLVFFLMKKLFPSGQPLPVEIIGEIIHIAGTTGMSFFYISSIVLLMRKDFWKKVFKPFELTGRIALSNYFLQTLVCTTLCYSYGFQLFGKINPLTAFLLVFPISAVQVLFSIWWLKYFRFGPVEWLWRTLTYGKKLNIKKRKG